MDVSATSSISFVKQLISRELDIPVDQQRLVFRGRTLADSQCLGDYNIVDGTKLHLVVRKADAGDEVLLTNENAHLWKEMELFLGNHFTQSDAQKVLDQFRAEMSKTIQNWSLDDIERVAQTHIEHSDDGPSSSKT